VPAYYASDVHLRLDRPDRSRRFARWLQTLDAADSLTLVGDLCDFWFASRQQHATATICEGLKALLEYQRRGGTVVVMGGNHDHWLGDYYQRTLGLRWVADSVDDVVGGIRIHAVHGHRLGGRSAWKGVMEGRGFLRTFGVLPHPMAAGLEHLLEWKNERGRSASDRRHLIAYRRYADQIADSADLVVLGHIHGTHDDRSRRPRLVVLGDWYKRTSYLRVDETGANLHIHDDA
jgi:UDP-2,3-diacylglucosamine hydrolase